MSALHFFNGVILFVRYVLWGERLAQDKGTPSPTTPKDGLPPFAGGASCFPLQLTLGSGLSHCIKLCQPIFAAVTLFDKGLFYFGLEIFFKEVFEIS
jgi:hypothetical protein